ncbi:hypothetical protein Sjap_002866 [Stephania japonica]|uniref:Uncharacterized protein n=1 Tax=Stephania japonica TaxID=461633 RepID=A0AAP0KMV7_9MAGN
MISDPRFVKTHFNRYIENDYLSFLYTGNDRNVYNLLRCTSDGEMESTKIDLNLIDFGFMQWIHLLWMLPRPHLTVQPINQRAHQTAPTPKCQCQVFGAPLLGFSPVSDRNGGTGNGEFGFGSTHPHTLQTTRQGALKIQKRLQVMALFIKSQFNRSVENNNLSFICARNDDCLYDIRRRCASSDSDIMDSTNIYTGSRPDILGSCNGFICFGTSYFYDDMWVFNPSTRAMLKLPQLPTPAAWSLNRAVLWGFGFCSKTQSFKVVRIVYEIEGRTKNGLKLLQRCFSSFFLIPNPHI